jgi:hypothetical protein
MKSRLLHAAVTPWGSDSRLPGQEMPHPLGSSRFISRARPYTLTWNRWIQYWFSQTIYLWHTEIVFSYLHLVLPTGVFSSGFLSDILYVCIAFLCDYPNNILWRLYLWSLSLRSFLLPLITVSVRYRYSPQHLVLKYHQHVPLLQWDNKSHTHTKRKTKLWFCIF